MRDYLVDARCCLEIDGLGKGSQSALSVVIGRSVGRLPSRSVESSSQRLQQRGRHKSAYFMNKSKDFCTLCMCRYHLDTFVGRPL